jgi:thiol-disulfide isomerase/thioredoxin
MRRFPSVRQTAIFAILFILLAYLPLKSHGEAMLTIGSTAPALDISDWIQRGEGKYPKVTRFEAGNVYVVEFWATWCGPCVQSMPHIAKLQEEYADRKVQIISVSDESVEEVQEFLKRKAGKKEGETITFDQLTKVYCLTTDPDGSTQAAYMQAAKQNGIPAAFIVGKDGKIEWIGHPMEMDQPLEKVVADGWDRNAFAIAYNEEKGLDTLKEQLGEILGDPSGQSPSAKKVDSAFALLDQFYKKLKTPRLIKQTRFLKFDLLIQFRSESPEVVAVGREVFEDFSARPIELQSLTYGLYEFANAGQIQNPQLIVEALKATQAVLPKVPAEQQGTVLDTIAHLQFKTGDIESALISAREAAKAPDATADTKSFVEKLEAELKKKTKP